MLNCKFFCFSVAVYIKKTGFFTQGHQLKKTPSKTISLPVTFCSMFTQTNLIFCLQFHSPDLRSTCLTSTIEISERHTQGTMQVHVTALAFRAIVVCQLCASGKKIDLAPSFNAKLLYFKTSPCLTAGNRIRYTKIKTSCLPPSWKLKMKPV